MDKLYLPHKIQIVLMMRRRFSLERVLMMRRHFSFIFCLGKYFSCKKRFTLNFIYIRYNLMINMLQSIMKETHVLLHPRG